MRIKILYEGHYRTLEEDFLELAEGILAEGKRLTVISAGAGQLDRLRNLLLETSGTSILGGIEFLPGISHLARKISSVPIPEESVSHSDRTLFALHAMEDLQKGEPLFDLKENTETAHSMGTFFESLFEHGVTPELYEITSLSLSRKQSTTERIIGRILGRYGEERNRGYLSCGDMVLERKIPDVIQGVYVFYGFYDLNPAQRRFIKRFMKYDGETYWFSPVSENSQWNSVYLRTRRLLQDIGIGSLVRSGNRKQMNSFAGFFEALPKQSRPSVPTDGFRITAVSGEIGACRAVLKRISELNTDKDIELGRMAVVRRKPKGESLVRLAHHEGIPINVPLKSKLSEIPEGEFVLNLLNAVKMDFYYVYLESLLASGMLKNDYAADPYEIAEVVNGSGIRMGLSRWRDWYSSLQAESRLGSFLRELDFFFSGLPRKAHAGEYLRYIRTFFESTTLESVRLSIRDSLFDPGVFRFSGEVSIAQFADALSLYYRSKDIVLRKPDPRGFQVLTIEKIRGNLFDSILLMDMEEGIYPGSLNEDPRLSDELREKLQMTLKSERETEDGFLLRQAGESAEISLDIIFRQTDNEGNEISPSPFISNLVRTDNNRSKSASWFVAESSSPLAQMAGGLHPGQKRILEVDRGEYPTDPLFSRAFVAERSRMNYDGFDSYDGIVESSPIKLDRISPTLLEGYMRCPFALLMTKGWNIKRTELAEIGTSPAPITKGLIIHEAVEEIIEKHGFTPLPEQVEAILIHAGESERLAGKLGSEYFEEIFIERQKNIILRSLGALSEKNWKFLGREVKLQGSLGDLLIGGRIDLILEDTDSNLVLLDLKTGKLPSISGKGKDRYFQLPFYYELAKENYPGKCIANVSYASISDKDPGGLRGLSGAEMDSRMETYQKNAHTVVAMIQEGLFPPIPTVNCDYCAFSGVCRRNPFTRIKEKVKSDNRREIFRGIVIKK